MLGRADLRVLHQVGIDALMRQDEGMGAVRTGRLVSAALDPVLVPAGFQAGQYGEGGVDLDRDTQVVFCAAADDFSARYPTLPQANQQGPDGGCVDLVIEVQADGTLIRLDLEETSIERTLRHVGLMTVAEDVARVDGCPLDESIPVIEAALRRLFNANPDVQP
jgi:hypothetical protein